MTFHIGFGCLRHWLMDITLGSEPNTISGRCCATSGKMALWHYGPGLSGRIRHPMWMFVWDDYNWFVSGKIVKQNFFLASLWDTSFAWLVRCPRLWQKILHTAHPGFPSIWYLVILRSAVPRTPPRMTKANWPRAVYLRNHVASWGGYWNYDERSWTNMNMFWSKAHRSSTSEKSDSYKVNFNEHQPDDLIIWSVYHIFELESWMPHLWSAHFFPTPRDALGSLMSWRGHTTDVLRAEHQGKFQLRWHLAVSPRECPMDLPSARVSTRYKVNIR